MTTSISYRELDQLMGELLPERTLLSTVTNFGGCEDGGSASSASSSSAAAAGGGDGDTIVITG